MGCHSVEELQNGSLPPGWRRFKSEVEAHEAHPALSTPVSVVAADGPPPDQAMKPSTGSIMLAQITEPPQIRTFASIVGGTSFSAPL